MSAFSGFFDNYGGMNNPTRRLFQQMEQREREANARAGHGDFLSDPNHPTRRLFHEMEQREREANARAGHGDFLSDPQHPTRRRFQQMEQQEREANARAGHGDFLTDPNHPVRRRLAAMHRRAPPHGEPTGDRAAAPDPQPARSHAILPPACRFAHHAVPEHRDCAICLETLQASQPCRRPPCLHVFHDTCLCAWSHHSSKCPLCNLDWEAPPTIQRYRLKEIASLRAAELRYLIAYLGIDMRGSVERTDLEFAILASRLVRLLSHRGELRDLGIGKLKGLVKCVCAQNTCGFVEKSELVGAIMASDRFEEENSSSAAAGAASTTASPAASTTAAGGTSAAMEMVRDLGTALEASVQEADARAAIVNAPLSSAILHSRLVPDAVVLLEVDRTLSTLRNALLEGDELASIRDALVSQNHAVELTSGAKIFVRPEQYKSVIAATADMDLKPRHIVVSSEFDCLVNKVIGTVKRTTVKRRRITTTQPSFGRWRSVQVNVEVKRTFIHLEIPSSLPSGPSSKHAASA